MNEQPSARTREDEVKRLFRSLNSPGVSKFIDANRLCASDEYVIMTDLSVEHMIQHGDYHYVALALKPIANSNRFESILKWLCVRAGLEFSFESGDLYLSKVRKATPKPDANLSEYTASSVGKGTAEDMARRWNKEKTARKRRYKSADLMDTHLVLPGCFEQGKRR